MDFKDLQKVNATIKTTDIGKGKEYAEVNQRVKAFRMLYPEGQITTEMLSLESGVCIFRAVVSTPTGEVLGTGTAYEKEGSSFINKTSYIENCETSAVGRALAMCGIGIDTSIASYEEVANAKANQEEKPAKVVFQDAKPDTIEEAQLRAKVMAYINRHKYTPTQIAKIASSFGKESINELTARDCNEYIKFIKAKGGNIDG